MIIEIDEYKNKISNYDPKKSEDFHVESAQLANKDFVECLKSRKYKRVVFMAGGTASGKTEYAFSYLNGKDQLVYDGTLKNIEGFTTKLQKIKRYDKNNSKIKVVLIIPQDITKSLDAFLNRDRKMETATFFETHIKSRLTLAKILKETKVRVEIFVSDVKDESDNLRYIRLKMSGKRNFFAKRLIETAKELHKLANMNGLEVDANYDSI